jgi:hypothetical protein
MWIKQTVKYRRIMMKTLMNLSLAAALVASSIVVAAPDAMAGKRHQKSHDVCLNEGEIGGIVVLGLVLGAVTGGVGSAIAYGGAYAVGGAALGGAGGALLGAAHGHHHCR